MIFVVIIISYLLGSIPFAYILIRLYSKQDIRTIGSGNVGAMNSFETTGKKWIGIVVFFLDMLKGLLAVIIAHRLTDNDFLPVVSAVLLVILGHNYSVFLKFKGGRGLATAVGSALLTAPIIILFWGIFWLIGIFILKKELIIANTIALAGTPIAFYFLSENLISYTSILNTPNILMIKLAVFLLCAIIFLAHVEPLKQSLNKKDDV
ncbi:MAG: glycerol-3-phosphate acyltransferase [bacterium]